MIQNLSVDKDLGTDSRELYSRSTKNRLYDVLRIIRTTRIEFILLRFIEKKFVKFNKPSQSFLSGVLEDVLPLRFDSRSSLVKYK